MTTNTSRAFRFRAALIIATAAALFAPLASANAAITEPGFESEVVASGFTLPTAVAFAYDGRIFVAEKGGTVRVVKNGALLPTPVISLSDVNTFGDRGLIGIALHPNFVQNGYMYLAYTYENAPGGAVGGPKTGRIVRVTVVGDVASEASKVVILGTVGGDASKPSCDQWPAGSDCIPSDSMSHTVGDLHVDGMGYIYATFGDGSNFDGVDPRALRAQNLNSLAGKMVRVSGTGKGLPLNPFFDGDENSIRSKIYAYGFRNAYRFNFHPTKPMIFLGDVGWSNYEEMNRVLPGGNYGWPCVEGTAPTAYACVANGVTMPLYSYAHDGNGAGSIAAGSFATHDAYPDEYDSSWFFGDYAQNWIKRAVVDPDTLSVTSVHDFMTDPDGPVDVVTGKDGNIYYLAIYTGELHRITHTEGNRRPVVSASANPTSGLAPLTVDFSSAGTIDPDGDTLIYQWDLGDGTYRAMANPTHTYAANGSYTATLTVTDIRGASASRSINISVGNQKPTPNIIAPTSGGFFSPNQVIALSGAGTDPEDGTLAAARLSWRVILHHNVHIHVIQEFAGQANPIFTAPDHGAEDVYLEIELTATDAGGLTEKTSVNLYFVEAATGNLVPNPSFETADATDATKPASWHKGGYGVNAAVFEYPVAGLAGSKAAKLTVTNFVDGNAKWYFDPVVVTPGQSYAWSNKFIANVPTIVMAQFDRGDGTYSYLQLAAPAAAAASTVASGTFTVPAGAQRVTIFHELNSNGVLTIDDFSLMAATAADTTAPTVSVTAPTGGASVSGTVAVTATAADNIGVVGVELYIDGVSAGVSDASAPYSLSWNAAAVTNGPHAITVRAVDAAGNATVSAAVNVTVTGGTGGSGPTNLILNGNLETVNGANPLGWSAIGWGNHTRTFTYPTVGRDGNKAATVVISAYPVGGDGDSRWFFDDVPVTPGTEYEFSDWYKSNIISDTIGRYTMADGSKHYFGLQKEIPSTGGTWMQLTGRFIAPENAVSVTMLHIISSVGNLSIDDVSLTVVGSGTPSETEAPVVTWNTPTANATVSGSVTLSVTATDNVGVTGLFFAVDGNPVGTMLTSAPWTYVLDTTAYSVGTHLLKATAHDAVGNNVAETISVTFEVPPPPPTGPTNHVVNPSVETADGTDATKPLGWTKGGWGTNTCTHSYPITGQTAAEKAMRIECTAYTNGDKKWFFSDVPVTAGETYTFAHKFRSNVTTGITARYTKADASVSYVGLGTILANSTWTSHSVVITIPADVVSMTVFHTLDRVGWLETDQFSLTGGTVTSQFAKGMVSLTFDDGWVEHATAAQPILDAAGVDGTFYIVTSETLGAIPTERLPNPTFATAGAGGDPANWNRGGWGTNTRTYSYPVAGRTDAFAAQVDVTAYTDGDAKWYANDVTVMDEHDYTISDWYKSTGPTQTLIRYTMADNSVQYAFQANLPSTGGAWTQFSRTVTIPVDVVSLTLFHVLTGVGSLTVDDFSVLGTQQYVSPAQVLALQAAGHEIGGHSRTHADLATLTPEQLTDEVTGSRTDLLGMGVTAPDTFAYPFGSYTAEVQEATAAAGYTHARSVVRGYNTPDADIRALKIQQVGRTVTIAQIQEWVAHAEADKTWLILMFHQIDNDLSATLGVTEAFLQDIVTAVGAADVDVVTLKEGAALLNP